MRRFMRSRPGIAVLVVLAAGAGAGVAALVHGGGSSPSRTAAAPPAPQPSRERSFLALVIPSPAKHLPGTDVPNRIARHARSLPLEKKVAQMMAVGFPGTSSGTATGIVRGMDVGGIVLDSDNFQSPSGAPARGSARGRAGGGTALASENFQSRAQPAGLVRDIRLAARRTHDDPPLIMAPQVGGEFRAFPALPPPDAPADIGGSV